MDIYICVCITAAAVAVADWSLFGLGTRLHHFAAKYSGEIIYEQTTHYHLSTVTLSPLSLSLFHIYMCIYIRLYVYMYIYIYVCMFIYTHIDR